MLKRNDIVMASPDLQMIHDIRLGIVVGRTRYNNLSEEWVDVLWDDGIVWIAVSDEDIYKINFKRSHKSIQSESRYLKAQLVKEWDIIQEKLPKAKLAKSQRSKKK
jgi:hypothetical protein